MSGIDADLHRLQPVALEKALEGEGVGDGRGEAIQLWKCRRLPFAEISPEHAALLHHRISALPDAGAKF